MKCIFWNIRGIANGSLRLALKRLIQKNSPDLVFIAEPWMDFSNFPSRWMSRFDLKPFAFNQRGSDLPNLWCFCKTHLNPVIVSIDNQQISFTINLNNTVLGFSVIYASTCYITRRYLWTSLNNIIANNVNPWTFIGDFNAIIGADEYKGSHNPARIPMQDFFHWSDSNKLIHLPTVGNFFTWSNGRRGRQLTEKRLDRVICNLDMLDLCNTVVCHTLSKLKSDHFPLLFTWDIAKVNIQSQFKFLKMWTLHDDCEKIVKDTWDFKFYGCPMYVLDCKLKLLKSKLKEWNKHIFGDVKLKVEEADKALKEIQQQISIGGYNDSLQLQEAKAQNELERALIIEEEYWREKAHIKWHVEGDRNTKFFHTYAKIRRKQNLISSLKINDVVTIDNHVIESHLIEHFTNIFNQGIVMQDTGLIERVIPSLVNESTNAMLTAIPSAEEITHAVKNLKSDSAPGPDGFGAIFFQKFWEIIKHDVISAVLQFFLQNWMLPNYNSNTLVLIPKNNEPNSINHYRPIALANFKSKIISKIIADRLAAILPSLISPQQKGFIKGRNIRDGICLTSEAINILGNKSFSGNVALKIDISKAFDTLNWSFLLKTLSCFGFCDKFCNWIDTILNSAMLSIGINGKQAGFFKCSNGVRQGDPLSPLLFCLAEEVLSRGIALLVNNNHVNLIKASRNCSVPSHTLYADDIMIFCRGDQKSINAIAALLTEYAAISGQVCNKDKSLIYAGGMSADRHRCLADILGFQMANPPFIYLGAPIFVGRPKPGYFSFIADKVKVKLAHWKSCLLSMAGRLQLITSVIHSMFLHCITIYNWPASLIKQISSWMRNFLWSGNMEQRKVLTVAWKDCCSSKKVGGLGIKALSNFNSVSNLQLCWIFVKGEQEWTHLLASRIKRNHKLISYHINSSIWTSIKACYSTVIDNTKWIIGNGAKVNFWLDTWLDEPIANTFNIPRVFHKHIKVLVKDWLLGQRWCIPENVLQAFPNLSQMISSVQIPESGVEDCIVWKDSHNGELSLQQAYNRFQRHRPEITWKNLIWNKHVPPSHAMVVWKMIYNKMPTDENFSLRGFSGPSFCSLCQCDADSTAHVFFECTFVRPIWNWLLAKLHFPYAVNNIQDCIEMLSISRSPQAKAVVLSMVCSLFYFVWRARNSMRFEGRKIHWKACISQIMARAKLVGDNRTNASDNNITSFLILKGMQVNLNPNRPASFMNVLWCPPPLGWVKVNIDGVARGNPVTMACGGLYRDSNAVHLGSFCDYMGEGNSELAEFWAAIIAIEKAVSLGWRKIWIETDCLLVVKAFSDTTLVPWKIRSRWHHCHDLLQSLDFMISHIYREANFCADYLANIGHSNRFFCWFNFVHPLIVKDYLLDMDGTPRLRLYR
ncbi:uncharacterized protein LOC131619766 [Vicia villosa]|uniref:uncharacterized protein LOC131619766 n=1 Tax=Vicia villosa TaxID=3911 RepID=UPI00273CCC77|nr:uncharacterized protein LOC131619766 [Vicia villosa]